jgi:hypothetical protein
MCPHTAIYVSSCCYICVLILLYMCPHCYICVLILLFVLILLYTGAGAQQQCAQGVAAQGIYVCMYAYILRARERERERETLLCLSVCACVCVCVRACACACVRACVQSRAQECRLKPSAAQAAYTTSLRQHTLVA